MQIVDTAPAPALIAEVIIYTYDLRLGVDCQRGDVDVLPCGEGWGRSAVPEISGKL